MQLINLTQCKRALCPLPDSLPWPASLPGISLHGLILAGKKKELYLNCEFQSKSSQLKDFLNESFPQLGLATIAHWSTDEEFESLVDLSNFLPTYGLRNQPDTLEGLLRIKASPEAFQVWINERRLSFKEFSVTKLASTYPKKLNQLFETIAKLQLSRQLGAKALELGSELIAMEKELPALETNSSEWMKRLEELRFPQATQSDQSAAQRLRAMKLPSYLQAQWVRRGDMSGAEIRLFVSSDYDFAKKIDRLEKLRQNFAKELFKDGAR